MRAKILIGAFLLFFLLVGVDFIFNLGKGLLSYRPAAGADELSEIDFSFWNKGGTGMNYITQGYGRTSFAHAYKDDWHNGIDIAAAYGAPIHSPSEGTVLATGNQDNYCPSRGFGRYVAVSDTGNHLVLWFAHLGKISVSPGDHIEKGDVIGTVGTSGFETGTHLHFSIFDANGFTMQSRNGCGPDATGKDLDPLHYLGTVYN